MCYCIFLMCVLLCVVFIVYNNLWKRQINVPNLCPRCGKKDETQRLFIYFKNVNLQELFGLHVHSNLILLCFRREIFELTRLLCLNALDC